MKRTGFFALVFAVLLLAGCSTSGAEYKIDVAAQNIAEKVDSVINSENLVAMEDSYLQNAMQLDPSTFSDYVVKINSRGINIDEYGVFVAPDDNSVDAVKEAAEGYIKFRLDSWMPEYMPEELPKLENAKVKVCGRYIMYAILSDDQCEAAFAEFEVVLKA